MFGLLNFSIIQERFPDGCFEDPISGHAFQRFREVALFPDADLMDAKILKAEAFHQ